MLKRKTTHKKAENLSPGDTIIETIPGGAAFADKVCDVRFVTDGKVHVDLNEYTATRIYDEGEMVRVCA